MDGLILVDKPAGPTSHDVVARLRRSLGLAKTGHFGTLDPTATGLLVVAVGRATRLNPFYSGAEKSYEGRIRLGFATDTYDTEGRPASAAAAVLPGPDAIEAALATLRGPQDQVPPPFSAKKVAGRPMYSYARKGRPVAGRPSRIVVHDFQGKMEHPPDLEFVVRCSSGTYVRALAHELGLKLGCGAHLSFLRRTAVGEFRVEAALPLEEIERRLAAGETGKILLPLESLLPDSPRAVLDAAGREMVRNGRAVPGERVVSADPEPAGDFIRVFDPEAKLIALARRDGASGELSPFLVLISL